MQFVEPLREHGIDLHISPFLSSGAFETFYSRGSSGGRLSSMIAGIARRVSEVFKAGNYDAVLVQREAMFFGPEIFEWTINALRGIPIILDLDDATYVPYTSPTYGKLGSSLKFFGKTDRLIRRSDTVLCGNRFIAEYVESKGTKAVIVPSTVDPNIFKPKSRNNQLPVLGWVGTHSTFPFLESIFPALAELSKTYDFTLRVIGSGRELIDLPGVDVENVPWNLEREPDTFASFDIGLYPIATSASASAEWLKGKSGFKAVQYLAVGIPFVMTPVGVCAEIGESGRTHFNASSQEEWQTSLEVLLQDSDRRESMGRAGREEFLDSFAPEKNLASISAALNSVR